MKSGLEDRNNPGRRQAAGQGAHPTRVSMKSGLEDRNNPNGSSWTLVSTTSSQ